MSTSLTRPYPDERLLVQLRIEWTDDHQAWLDATADDVRAGLRLICRAAVRVSIARDHHYAGRFKALVHDLNAELGLSKRSIIRWANAGDVLRAYVTQHVTLANCQTDVLEILHYLNDAQFAAFMTAHPNPADLSRDQVRAEVNRLRGRQLPAAPGPTETDNATPEPATVQPELADWDNLIAQAADIARVPVRIPAEIRACQTFAHRLHTACTTTANAVQDLSDDDLTNAFNALQTAAGDLIPELRRRDLVES